MEDITALYEHLESLLFQHRMLEKEIEEVKEEIIKLENGK